MNFEQITLSSLEDPAFWVAQPTPTDPAYGLHRLENVKIGKGKDNLYYVWGNFDHQKGSIYFDRLENTFRHYDTAIEAFQVLAKVIGAEQLYRVTV